MIDTMRRSRVAWCALSLALLGGLGGLVGLVGCKDGEPVDGTPGELHSVAFAYQRGCFFGCPLGQPLLTGTRQSISLSDAGDIEGLRAKTSDKQVAEFAVERACYCERDDQHGGRIEIANDASCEAPFRKHCDNSVLVEAKGDGDATLELRDAGDGLLDRVTVLVRDADDADFFATYPERLGTRNVDELELSVGSTVDVAVELYDDRGRKLLAPEGVHWEVADEATASVAAFLIPASAALDAGLDVVVQGEGKGTTQLRVEVPGLSRSIDVTVDAAK